jgi:hypothetical protein
MKKLKWFIKQGTKTIPLSISDLILLTSSNKALTIVEHINGNEIIKVVEFIK